MADKVTWFCCIQCFTYRVQVAAKAEKDFHFLTQQRTRTSQAQVFGGAGRGSGAFV